MSDKTADVTISCPHCRRQYTMKIDPERLQRLKTRATCGRCGKTFDAATRIVTGHQPAAAEAEPPIDTRRTDPKLPRTDPKPAAVTASDVRDEMEELAREFAEAAARFTPVGIKRSTLGLPDAPATTKPVVASEDPTKPGVIHASFLAAAAAAATADAPSPAASPAAQSATELPAIPQQLSLDAEPAGEEEFAAAVPTLSRPPVAPRSWLELADPGLVALQSPTSPSADALESLLNDGESIALPPPPTAS
jgi:hypothetical protein